MSGAIVLRPDHLALVREILAAHLPPGATVRVFGSRATGRAKERSDLDLAVDAGRPLTLREAAVLSDAFEDSDLPFRVDVVDVPRLSETFRAIVARDGVALTFVPDAELPSAAKA